MSEGRTDLLGIAELAERVGLTRRTIRYYVAEGLLPAPVGRGARRVYTAEHLSRLQTILRLKAAFLPLREIRRRLLEMGAADEDAPAGGSWAPAESSGPNRAAEPAPGYHPAQRPIASLGPFLSSGDPSGGSGPVEVSSWPGRIFPIVASPTVGPGGDEMTSDVWRRVTLAPGVELHYQLSGDRRRDEAIAHLIRAASSILR